MFAGSQSTTEISGSKRKRPKTAKRAEQNRAAQRRYRDKLKFRQAQLEDFARRRGFDPEEPRPRRFPEPDWSDSLNEDSPPEANPREDNQILMGRANPYPNALDSSPKGTGTLQAWLALQDQLSPQYPDFMLRSPAELISLLEDGVSSSQPVLDTEKILAEYDLRALNSTKQLLSSRKRFLLEHLFHVLGLNDRESNADLVQLAFSQGLNLRQLLTQGLKHLLENDEDFNGGFQSMYGLGNPYANNLRCKRFATLDAVMSNALAIGYHIPDLYTAQKTSCFWRPEIKRVSDLSGELAASFMRMPPHLRPTSLQIQRPHKPYIDLLPFPALRMRIIHASSQTPPTIDEYDLKHDIIHDGVVCWSDNRPSTGQPWDMRSWEISAWFKRKWTPVLFPEEAEPNVQELL